MITFKFHSLPSTASPLYEAEVFDENEKRLAVFGIACNDESKLTEVAQEAYNLLLNPVKPLGV